MYNLRYEKSIRGRTLGSGPFIETRRHIGFARGPIIEQREPLSLGRGELINARRMPAMYRNIYKV